MNDEVEHFKSKYRAHIQEGQRRYAVPKRRSMDPLSLAHEPFDLNFEYESSIQIDMSKRDFDTLIGMEKYWEEQLSRRDITPYAGHAKAIVDKHERELRIRNNNPAAKAAYEQYQLLLALSYE